MYLRANSTSSAASVVACRRWAGNVSYCGGSGPFWDVPAWEGYLLIAVNTQTLLQPLSAQSRTETRLFSYQIRADRPGGRVLLGGRGFGTC